MPSKPLLIFPRPAKADRDSLNSNPRRSPSRSAGDLWVTYFPKLKALRDALERETVNIHNTAIGLEPEFVLVLEVESEIEAFYNCVRRIEGLEWLVEGSLHEDGGMNSGIDCDEPCDGRLYMVMTNQDAIDQLLSLWNQYKQDSSVHFDIGLAKFKDLFALIRDIRRWSVADRLRDTGIVDYWKDVIESGEDQSCFDIELWFRGNKEKQRAAEERLRIALSRVNGQVVDVCKIEEIMYHALRVRIPCQELRDVIISDDADFLKAEEVMFVRPCGQMMAPKYEDEIESFPENFQATRRMIVEQTEADPIIAVLDGYPLVAHKLIKDRIIIDDPDDFASDCPPKERIHGTSMASLILHGDLTCNSDTISRKIVVRPILKPYQNGEKVPDNYFLLDLIHRAVKGFFENADGAVGSAPTVKVINLSLGDISRVFVSEMSPLARLIDWLSYRYNVLFVISAGNHGETIRINRSRSVLEAMSTGEFESTMAKALDDDKRHRRLLSPAESVNAITVGATHQDGLASFDARTARNLYDGSMPSPITSVGDGYNRSVKPDVLMPGGRQLYRDSSCSSTFLDIDVCSSCYPPGVKVACPRGEGDLTAECFARGTSCSAALTTRNCAIAYESLLEVLPEKMGRSEFDNYVACFLKAMIVHASEWGQFRDDLSRTLGIDATTEVGRKRISKILGYGACDISRVLECTAHRVTLIGYGELKNEKAHVYEYPLPISVNSRRGLKRLKVTLAWITPVTPSNRRYRNARLWFTILEESRTIGNRTEVDWQKVRRGTVQHEIYEQILPNAVLDGDTIKIKVNCLQNAAKIAEPVKYALFVTYEIEDVVSSDIYSEIAERVALASEVKTDVLVSSV